MSLFSRLATPAQQDPTSEERFNAASALSAYALSTFDRVVSDLEQANDDLLIVEAEALNEIDRLDALCEMVLAQRAKNDNVIGNVRALTA